MKSPATPLPKAFLSTRRQGIILLLCGLFTIGLAITFIAFQLFSLQEMKHFLQIDLKRFDMQTSITQIEAEKLNLESKKSLDKNIIKDMQFLNGSLQTEAKQSFHTEKKRSYVLTGVVFMMLTGLFFCYRSIFLSQTRLRDIKLNQRNLEELLNFKPIETNRQSPKKASLAFTPSLEELQQALLTDQFVIYYQPIVNATDAQLLGVEALIRWQHPTRGLLTPDSFIALCEENHFIIPLGAWICRTSCEQIKKWHALGFSNLYVSVNLSTVQLEHPNLTKMVEEVLETTGLPPKYLRLEITESQIMNDIPHCLQTLTDLRQLGLQLSIDDFGTGYSSLFYLKEFPFSQLKIDKSFIQDLPTNIACVGIVESIIKLSKSLGLTLIAEGVETKEQVAILKNLHCDALQGYLFGKPMPVDKFTQMFVGNLVNLVNPNLSTSPYSFHLLTSVETKATIELITQYFHNYGTLTNHFALTPSALTPYVTELVERAISDRLSIIALEHNQVIGCSIVLDLANPFRLQNKMDKNFNLIFTFLQEVTHDFFHETTIHPKHIANLLITVVAKPDQQHNLLTELTLQSVQHAKEEGFDFICCTFNHLKHEKETLTALINNKLRLRSRKYKEFQYQGHYPFFTLEGSLNAYICELREGAKLNYRLKDAM